MNGNKIVKVKEGNFKGEGICEEEQKICFRWSYVWT